MVKSDVTERRLPFKDRARPYWLTLPALLVTVGILYPFAIAVFYSFTNYSFQRPLYKMIGFGNWTKMFSSGDFWNAVSVTLRYAFITTGVELVLGLCIALLLYNGKGRIISILKVTLIFPLMVAPVIATLVWQLMTNTSVGIIEKALNFLSIYNFPWASSPKTALFTAALIDVWVYTPFVMILALAGLNSLPKSPFESATIDGGSAWFTFKNLTLPMIKPYLYIALIFRLMAALQEFTIIFALTKGGPGNTLMNLSLTGYNMGFAFQKIGEAMPFLLFLWVIINVISKRLVKNWQKLSKRME